MKDESREKYLFESSPVLTAIGALAFPSILAQVIMVIYNMSDTFFVGLTGNDAMISAATICMPAFMFLSAISNLFGVGGASAISRALGRQDMGRARKASSFALWGCIGMTILYSLGAWLWMDPFIVLLGGSDAAVHAYAREYMLYTVVIGGMATSINTMLAHLLRAEGRSMQACVGVTLGGLINIALTPLFMFVLLPKGRGILGAAIATAVSNGISLLYFIVLLFRNRQRSVLSFMPGKRILADGIPGEILSTGTPACLMTLCENISFAVLDNIMATAGTAAQAGLGIAKKVNMLAHCIVRGMCQGVLPLISYNFASGNRRRMRAVTLVSTGLSIFMAMLCMGACLIWAPELVGIFLVDGAPSTEYAIEFLHVLCLGCPFSACAYAFISFFQATGNGKRSLILALLRKGILDTPLMFILCGIYSANSAVWATPIADVVCCIVSIALVCSHLQPESKPAERCRQNQAPAQP